MFTLVAKSVWGKVSTCTMTRLLSSPTPVPYTNGGGLLGSKPRSSETMVSPRYPHTRAQLAAVARQHRAVDSVDTGDEDDASRISASLLSKVVGLLVDEEEDELKDALKEAFPDMNDDAVCFVAYTDTDTNEYIAYTDTDTNEYRLSRLYWI